MSHDQPNLAKALREAAAPFIVGIIVTVICLFACGETLGLFFGGMVMTVIILPPLAARHARPGDGLFAATCFVDAVALLWIIVALMNHSFLQGLQAYAVLVAVALAVFGMLISLRRIIGVAGASAITTIFFIAWLAWPIWMSPWAGPRTVALLAPVHPFFAINRVFMELGFWTQQPLMYDLTTLGQDVPHALPASILPCVLLHVFMALSLGWPAWWWSAQAASPPPPPAKLPAL